MSSELEAPPDLAPESRWIFARLRELGLLDGEASTVEEIRRRAALEGPLRGEPPAVARVEEIGIATAGGTLPLRVYWPGGPTERAILWLHGGGWMIGDLADCEADCRRLAVDTASLVVAVDYRLAPEHPFPAALEDARAALEWLTGELGQTYPSRPIVVGGDSAGGNLAAALCILVRDRAELSIAQQLLIYPVANDDFETSSYREFGEHYVLTGRSMEGFWASYVGAQVEAPELAAVLRVADLRGLPPATFVVAGCDVLRDEAEDYAARLGQAGVPVRVLRHAGQLHGFWACGSGSDLPRRVNAELRQSMLQHDSGLLRRG